MGAWREVATRLTNGDSDLGGVLEDVRNMSDDVPEGDAMDGWMSCILYVEGRHGLDDDAVIRADLSSILSTHDMSNRNRRPSIKRRKSVP